MAVVHFGVFLRSDYYCTKVLLWYSDCIKSKCFCFFSDFIDIMVWSLHFDKLQYIVPCVLIRITRLPPIHRSNKYIYVYVYVLDIFDCYHGNMCGYECRDFRFVMHFKISSWTQNTKHSTCALLFITFEHMNLVNPWGCCPMDPQNTMSNQRVLLQRTYWSFVF